MALACKMSSLAVRLAAAGGGAAGLLCDCTCPRCRRYLLCSTSRLSRAFFPRHCIATTKRKRRPPSAVSHLMGCLSAVLVCFACNADCVDVVAGACSARYSSNCLFPNNTQQTAERFRKTYVLSLVAARTISCGLQKGQLDQRQRCDTVRRSSHSEAEGSFVPVVSTIHACWVRTFSRSRPPSRVKYIGIHTTTSSCGPPPRQKTCNINISQKHACNVSGVSPVCT